MTALVKDASNDETTTDEKASGISVKRLAGHIGAEISGVDLSKPLDAATVAKIRAKLLKYKVVFFRDQHFGHAEQIAFARQFGELTHAHPHEDAPPAEFPEILTIDPRRYEQRYGTNFREEYQQRQYTYYAGWHTDVTAAVNPPAASILRAETVPPFGGDASWTTAQLRWGPSRTTRVCASRAAWSTAVHCCAAMSARSGRPSPSERGNVPD
jgi:taurine dioxygenase